MLVDLETLCDAKDAYALVPADLPSVKGALAEDPSAFARAAAPSVLPFTSSPSLVSPDARAFDVSEAPVERSRSRRRARAAAAAVIVVALSMAGVRAIHEAHRGPRYATASPFVYSHSASQRVMQAIRDPLGRVQESLERSLGSAPTRGPSAEECSASEALVSAWDGNPAGSVPRVSLRHGRGNAPRVLVIETPSGVLDSDSRAALEQALQGRGFHVLGAEPDEQDIADDAIAEALHAIGLGDPSDPEAVERLQSWVDDSELVDRLVWCGRCGDGKNACLLFQPRETPPTSSRIVIVPGEKQRLELR